MNSFLTVSGDVSLVFCFFFGWNCLGKSGMGENKRAAKG